ncbi:MAG: adenosine deaminase [Chitinophagaceae bacterium]|nr:MAG: adenosine deaminase [Chitinophagaceae bacterium]
MVPGKFNILPKVELHLHLDCSLSYEVVKQISPSVSEQEYIDSFIAPPKCTDLADYITRAVRGFELMQTKENLRLVTLDLFKQLKSDNVIYAELRFAPLQHTMGGLTPREAVQAVNEATEEGITATGVEARVILCTLRHYSAEQSFETVNLVKELKGSKIVGFDIAADEAGYPIDNHIAAFNFANENSIPCTAHAGEAKGPESVWETLTHFCPSRLGHGVRSVEDQTLIEYLKKKNIHLEVCPTSNIQTNVYDKIENHTVDKIFNAGVSMNINTDARTISNVTLAQEYDTLATVFGWGRDHFMRCNLAAIAHAFVEPAVKERLSAMINKAYCNEI